MFAMFHLGRPDVFPLGDLAVRKGLQELYKLQVVYLCLVAMFTLDIESPQEEVSHQDETVVDTSCHDANFATTFKVVDNVALHGTVTRHCKCIGENHNGGRTQTFPSCRPSHLLLTWMLLEMCGDLTDL